jgi:hypothetical protein
MRTGIYETHYGNAARVTKSLIKRELAFDLDMQEYIPLSEVDATKYIRPVLKGD